MTLAAAVSVAAKQPEARAWSAASELEGDLSDWVLGPAHYLLTRGEAKQFKQLESRDRRAAFIEAFWARRDPSPADPRRNEYRDEFWRRVAVADAEFRRGDDGWDSARGEIFIVFGPPTYQSYEQDHRLSKPLIQWFYERRPSKLLPITVRLFFADLFETGEYLLVNQDLAALHPFFTVRTAAERIPSTFRPALEDAIQRSILWEVETPEAGPSGAAWSAQAALEGALLFDVTATPNEALIDLEIEIRLRELTYTQQGELQVGEVDVRLELGEAVQEDKIRVELTPAELEAAADGSRTVRHSFLRPIDGGLLRVTLTEPVSGRVGKFEERIPALDTAPEP
jgi:GWxTD domain-containing protein